VHAVQGSTVVLATKWGGAACAAAPGMRMQNNFQHESFTPFCHPNPPSLPSPPASGLQAAQGCARDAGHRLPRGQPRPGQALHRVRAVAERGMVAEAVLLGSQRFRSGVGSRVATASTSQAMRLAPARPPGTARWRPGGGCGGSCNVTAMYS
jgi:hypothetical protein